MGITKKILNLLNFLFSLSAIGTLIWFHGYEYKIYYLQPHSVYLHISFGFFVVQFVIRAYLSKDFMGYVRNNRLECLLFIFLLLEIGLNTITGYSITWTLLSSTGLTGNNHLYILTLHIVLLIIVGFELGKASARSTIWKLSPPLLFILSFIVLIIVGSSLLMLPEMTNPGSTLNFIDAFFTSVSASCVTGLSVVETSTCFSIKGKILILILIQIGGLNIIAFATYFITFYRRKFLENKNLNSVNEILHTSHISETKNMIKMVVLTSLIIELIGTIFLYYQWGESLQFSNLKEQLFYSVFHSVSAFNNAGFTLFTDGFTNPIVQNSYYLHITIALLVILGGIGFTTIGETFRFGNIINYFRRRETTFSLQSRISLISSLVLILLGTVLFYGIERSGVLSDMNLTESMITSFFQSVTSRTAGFSTVDFGSVSVLTLIVLMVFMFIGASSGSTGGGIKTSTFAVLLIGALKAKKRRSNYGKSFLTNKLVKKAFSILVYSIIVISFGTLILIISEPEKAISQLIFEEVSAFGTVGLSTGITSSLSSTGKIVIIISMIIGRIGPLALAYSMIRTVSTSDEKEKDGIMLG